MDPKEQDELWENSHDSPCAYCEGPGPCYVLVMGLPACERCREMGRDIFKHRHEDWMIES